MKEINTEKICRQCEISFEVTESDYLFLDKVSPTFDNQKYQIPAPTLCPDCRQQRRLSFRNERNLYRRKCDASGKDIVSIYSPDLPAGSQGKPYKVYDQKIWWSDDRNPMAFGRDFDFERTFTEQFGVLMVDVPYPSMLSIGCENCDYTCYTLDSKECYMSSGITKSEKVIYSYFIRASDSMTDCTMTYESSYCYECVECFKVYSCAFCKKCIECTSCLVCEDCTRCQYCIACSGLTDKMYYYNNKPIGKEAYQELVKSLGHTQLNNFRKDLDAISGNQPKKFANILLSENVTGDDIVASKNCECCFDIKDCEDCKFVYFTPHGRSSQDCVYSAPLGVEYCYDVCSTMGTTSAFTFINRRGSNCYYVQHCHNCNDCFGCVGLRDKQYCIFNKQYASKEEYEKEVGRIIRHMQTTRERGEFFHPSLSQFGYNETIAQEYFPVTSNLFPVTSNINGQEAGSRKQETFGYKRSHYIAPIPQVDKVIKGQDLPNSIFGFEYNGENEELGINILKVAILCETTNKPFRVVPQELEFYRRHHLPLPAKHPNQRHLDRMKLRNPRQLYKRNCDQCGVGMQTPYSCDFQGKVYCEKCYEKEMFG